MLALHRDPEGKEVFSKTAPSENHYTSSHDQDDYNKLKQRVIQLENHLSRVRIYIRMYEGWLPTQYYSSFASAKFSTEC